MRLLVVEDEPKLGALIVRALRAEGHAVDLCESGEDALWRAGAVAYDAIVLDVGLPGIDGFQVALAMRARCPRARIVLTSSRDLADLGEDRVSACGAAGFVHKAELSRAALAAATATA